MRNIKSKRDIIFEEDIEPPIRVNAISTKNYRGTKAVRSTSYNPTITKSAFGFYNQIPQHKRLMPRKIPRH